MTDTSPATLFIGLGMMGEPMVRRYAPTRRTLVSDKSAETAGRVAADNHIEVLADLGELPDCVDVVILMLPNTDVVEKVLLGEGLLSRMPSGGLIIDMGIMMGGSVPAMNRAKAHVAPLGSRVLEVGAAGSGHAAKALNNWLSAANIAAAAEILSIAVDFGVPPTVMIEVLNASTGRSQATEVKYPKHILPGSYDSRFALDLMLKDLRIGSGLAEQCDAYAPILSTVLQSVEQAQAFYGVPGLDHTELARYYADKNHVSFQIG